MVGNYDRIYSEIKKEAQRLAPDHDIDADTLVFLVMEIVDLESRHCIKNIRINQLIEDKILSTAMSRMMPEEQ